MKKPCFLCQIFVLLFPGLALATPSISGLSGTVTLGTFVTISGSSFGTKSPAAPAVWDNGLLYTGFTNGQCIPTPSENTTCPGTNPYGWIGEGSSHAVYFNNVNTRGVWSNHYSNVNATKSNSVAQEIDMDGLVVTGVSTTKQMYVTWWIYTWLSASTQGSVQNTQNKWCRMLSGSGLTWGDSGQGTVIWAPWPLVDAYDFSSGDFGVVSYSAPGVPATTWSRQEMLFDSTGAANSSPAVTVGVNGVYDSYTPNWSGAGISAPGWVINTIAGLGADFDNGNTPTFVEPEVEWGEIYADNTFSRVEVCSGSTWAARSHCEIQIPSAWSATSATVTVNQGSFSSGASAYLYVVDSTNTANSSGYPVTFGSGGGGSAPPMPSEPFLLSN